LPLTLETPTPVSALMHAGIVNAGGYLIIRTSPLLVTAPWVLSVLAIVGGVTACLAATAMLTQTSVKKSLAYSTIAQMGFMMLQCGLGAFSAAMLHILAHSLYKAHAFLNSGSVMSERAATAGASANAAPLPWVKVAATGGAMVAFLLVAFFVVGVDPATKPGALLLGSVLCLALTHWVSQVMRSSARPLVVRSMTVAAVLCLVYVASFRLVDSIIAGSLPATTAIAANWLVVPVLLAGFASLFLLHSLLAGERQRSWLHRWYVHASNGFYVENTLRRVFGPLSSI
jgi:NAD(P)H-quinone oxidoreductase subunit 5